MFNLQQLFHKTPLLYDTSLLRILLRVIKWIASIKNKYNQSGYEKNY